MKVVNMKKKQLLSEKKIYTPIFFLKTCCPNEKKLEERKRVFLLLFTFYEL